MNPSASLPFPAPGRTAAESQAGEEPPHGDLVTVIRVFNALEAEMLRGCLEAEGIPATLGDVQTVQTDTLLTVALGGVRVMVPEVFADAARPRGGVQSGATASPTAPIASMAATASALAGSRPRWTYFVPNDRATKRLCA